MCWLAINSRISNLQDTEVVYGKERIDEDVQELVDKGVVVVRFIWQIKRFKNIING